MFYLIRNLKTQLLFTPYEIDKLANDDEILKRLKQKIQGRCHPQYGYIIQFIRLQNQSQQAYKVSLPLVEEAGCKVTITFCAITFKPEKNDILDIIVTEIHQDIIKGTLGHAHVFIPKRNMGESWNYKKDEGIFVMKNGDLKIEKGTKLRCKCFEVKTQMNFQMKILAELGKDYLGPLN